MALPEESLLCFRQNFHLLGIICLGVVSPAQVGPPNGSERPLLFKDIVARFRQTQVLALMLEGLLVFAEFIVAFSDLPVGHTGANDIIDGLGYLQFILMFLYRLKVFS